MQQNQRRALAPAELLLDSAMTFDFFIKLFSRADPSELFSSHLLGFSPRGASVSACSRGLNEVTQFSAQNRPGAAQIPVNRICMAPGRVFCRAIASLRERSS